MHTEILLCVSALTEPTAHTMTWAAGGARCEASAIAAPIGHSHTPCTRVDANAFR